MALGTVHIPKAVKADGKPLPAGTYQVRLTTDEAKPDAVGTSGKLERWVEFVQKGQVKGREVVSIVPQSEIKLVEKDAPAADERIQGSGPEGERLPARLDQQGGQPLPRAPGGCIGSRATMRMLNANAEVACAFSIALRI